VHPAVAVAALPEITQKVEEMFAIHHTILTTASASRERLRASIMGSEVAINPAGTHPKPCKKLFHNTSLPMMHSHNRNRFILSIEGKPKNFQFKVKI
jgi:hypothetical protein